MNRRHFLKSLLGGTAAVAAGLQCSSATVRAVAPGAFTVNYIESYDGSLRKFFGDWVKLIRSDTVDESKVKAVHDNIVTGRNRVVNHESVPTVGFPATEIQCVGAHGRQSGETLSQAIPDYEVSFTLPSFLKQI